MLFEASGNPTHVALSGARKSCRLRSDQEIQYTDCRFFGDGIDRLTVIPEHCVIDTSLMIVVGPAHVAPRIHVVIRAK